MVYSGLQNLTLTFATPEKANKNKILEFIRLKMMSFAI